MRVSVLKKVDELGEKYFPDNQNIWGRGNNEKQYVKSACIEMALFKDQEFNNLINNTLNSFIGDGGLEERCEGAMRVFAERLVNLITYE